MGVGKAARSRRVVYQWRFKRQQHDDRAINAMVARAEKVADGTRPLKKDRFVKLTGTQPGVDWDLVERARQLAGLKGYVSNLPAETMTGEAVISSYHDLWQVEKSFRMAKSDLRARPVFHHERDSIEAHLTIVFAALALSRHHQDLTDLHQEDRANPTAAADRHRPGRRTHPRRRAHAHPGRPGDSQRARAEPRTG